MIPYASIVHSTKDNDDHVVNTVSIEKASSVEKVRGINQT